MVEAVLFFKSGKKEKSGRNMVNRVDGNSYYDYAKPKKADIPNTGEKFSLGYQKDELSPELKEKKEKEVSDQEKQQTAERNGVRIELSSRGVEKQKQAKAVEAQAEAFGLTDLLETIRTILASTVTAVRDIFRKIWNDPQPEDTAQDGLEKVESTGTIETAEFVETAEAAESLEIIETAGRPSEVIGTMESLQTTEMAGMSENAGIASAISLTEIKEATGRADSTEDETASYMDRAKRDREIRHHLRNGDMNQVIRLLTDNGRKTAARNSTLLTYYDKNGRVVELDASVKERTLHGDRNTQKL